MWIEERATRNTTMQCGPKNAGTHEMLRDVERKKNACARD